MAQTAFKRLFVLFLFVTIILVADLCAYGAPPGSPSDKDLQEMVDLLENPQKREAFLKDLKQLLAAKAAVAEKGAGADAEAAVLKKKPVIFVEEIFNRFESLSQRIVQGISSAVRLVLKIPAAAARAGAFLRDSENIIRLLKLLGNLVLGIFLALVSGKILQRAFIRSEGASPGLGLRLLFGLGRILAELAPYGILLAALFVLFSFFPTFSAGQTLVLLVCSILFFYRLTIAVFRALLTPEQSGWRILPLSDVNANYGWVWLHRFSRYTAFYFVVVKGCATLGMDAESFLLVRGLLLIVFPFMFTVLIMQVGREIRLKHLAAPAMPETESGATKVRSIIVRYWAVLASGYAWILSIFLIIHYQKGFQYLFAATLWTVVTLFFLALALRVQRFVFSRFFAVNERVKARFPGLEEKTNRYILILAKTARVLLIVTALGMIAQIWGVPVSGFIASRAGSLIILRVVAIAITAGVVMAIIETSRFIAAFLLRPRKKRGRSVEPTQKMQTLIPVIRTAVNIAAGFVGGIIILDQIGVNTTPILAGAGIIGLAVGFGSQTLVKDLINGLFILFEESVRVGDYVDLGSNEGMVEGIGLRTVKLRDVSGNVHVVPNSSIDAVMNYSKDFSRAVIDIGVAYKEDADEVIAVLKEIGEEMRRDPDYGKSILEPFEVLGLQSFDDSAVVIRCRFTTRPLKQWGLKREFNRRVKRVFDERGIEIPFPHRTIFMGETKEEPSKALPIPTDADQAPVSDA